MATKVKFSRFSLLFALIAIIATTSCEKIMEGEGDCTLHCQLKFKYDMNLKFADAFASSVPYVTVYFYDINTGKLVHQQTDSGEALSKEGYVMEITDLKAGTYDVVAWCGDGLQEGNFDVPSATVGTSGITELTCTMERGENGEVTKDVRHLFHGKERVTFEDTYGTHVRTVSLTKNTNNVKVILQHLSGVDVDKDMFRFEIKDANGKMAHDNALMDDQVLTYSPWSVRAGTAGIDADLNPVKAQTSVSVALAEFTVSRMMADTNPILSVYNVKENELVLSIPLKDYALLVKGHYNRDMSDQEYLDRQDEYNLTFFLDEFGNWATSRVIINSWNVVLQDGNL